MFMDGAQRLAMAEIAATTSMECGIGRPGSNQWVSTKEGSRDDVVPTVVLPWWMR
jgi:hypothetical protein